MDQFGNTKIKAEDTIIQVTLDNIEFLIGEKNITLYMVQETPKT